MNIAIYKQSTTGHVTNLWATVSTIIHPVVPNINISAQKFNIPVVPGRLF